MRTDLHCTNCSCPLESKVRCLSCECPLKKWEAVASKIKEDEIKMEILNAES